MVEAIRARLMILKTIVMIFSFGLYNRIKATMRIRGALIDIWIALFICIRIQLRKLALRQELLIIAKSSRLIVVNSFTCQT
jgi:hypothetical protein